MNDDNKYKPGTAGMIGLDGRFIPAGDPDKVRPENRIRGAFCLAMAVFSALFVILPAYYIGVSHGLGWTGTIMLLGASGFGASVIGFFGS